MQKLFSIIMMTIFTGSVEWITRDTSKDSRLKSATLKSSKLIKFTNKNYLILLHLLVSADFIAVMH